RMSVIARHPELCRAPLAALLELRPERRDGAVDDAQRLAYVAALLSGRVRGLVDAGHRGENEAGAFVAHAPHHMCRHLTVDLQPALHVAAKVRARGAKRGTRREGHELPAAREPACDHA